VQVHRKVLCRRVVRPRAERCRPTDEPEGVGCLHKRAATTREMTQVIAERIRKQVVIGEDLEPNDRLVLVIRYGDNFKLAASELARIKICFACVSRDLEFAAEKHPQSLSNLWLIQGSRSDRIHME